MIDQIIMLYQYIYIYIYILLYQETTEPISTYYEDITEKKNRIIYTTQTERECAHIFLMHTNRIEDKKES